jgi:exocyst complex component 2
VSKRVLAKRSRLILRILIELEGSDEPAWAWLEYQHAHIVDRMKVISQKAQQAVKCMFAAGCEESADSQL